MKIPELLQANSRSFSFELFPPKTDEAVEKLLKRAKKLKALRPAFISVTYGAGGSTRERTRELVVRLNRELGLNGAAHLTCVGHSRAELIEILGTLRDEGVKNIVALRGDAPGDQPSFQPHPDGLRYGNELVELIRGEFGSDFGIAVAGYPEGHPDTPNKLTDLENLKRKVDAGADAVVTQLFFENRDFYDFCERCEIAGIRVPIIAGLMPVVSRKGIFRMAGLSGARIPAGLLRRLHAAADDKEVEKIGTDWATEQARDLLDHDVRGIHFYTLNKSGATTEIYRRLGLTAQGSTGSSTSSSA